MYQFYLFFSFFCLYLSFSLGFISFLFYLLRKERKYKARKFPEKYMANIADGMDQHTTSIPRVRRVSKAMSALTTVRSYLVGAIIHNVQPANGKEVFKSFDFCQFLHDSNLTMTALLDVLVQWAEMYLLPAVLYLQMDNCMQERIKTDLCLLSWQFLSRRRYLRFA